MTLFPPVRSRPLLNGVELLYNPGEYSVQPVELTQPWIPFAIGAAEVTIFGGTPGGVTSLNGSSIQDACARYLPLPRFTAWPGFGFIVGPPQTPKSAPPMAEQYDFPAVPARARSAPP